MMGKGTESERGVWRACLSPFLRGRAGEESKKSASYSVQIPQDEGGREGAFTAAAPPGSRGARLSLIRSFPPSASVRPPPRFNGPSLPVMAMRWKEEEGEKKDLDEIEWEMSRDSI